MEESSRKKDMNAKLDVNFPKSKEDHRLQLATINGSIFAIIFSALESNGPIRLCCEEWSLILLAPIKSKSNILISATNVICLNEIASEEGNVNIHASNKLIKFGQLAKPLEKLCEMGEKGEFQFDDDPGTLLQHYRLFKMIVSDVRSDNEAIFPDAQQKFITSLCLLADKVEGTAGNLDLHKVLSFWGVPFLPG